MNSILPDTLELAVMLRVPELHRQPFADVWAQLAAICGTFPTLLGSKGDLLLYGSKKKGEVADLFNKTAHAVSLMAVAVPGGTTLFDRTFNHPHPELDQG